MAQLMFKTPPKEIRPNERSYHACISACEKAEWAKAMKLFHGFFARQIVKDPCMVYLYTYIWLMFMVNVGKYSIHGSYGI